MASKRTGIQISISGSNAPECLEAIAEIERREMNLSGVVRRLLIEHKNRGYLFPEDGGK